MARKMLTVTRKAHTRTTRSGKKVRIPKTTFKIKDRGLKGRGPNKIKLSEGGLGGPGYASKPAATRHALLKKSVRNTDYATTARRVVALRNLGKRTMSKTDLAKLQADQNWLKRECGSKPKKGSKRGPKKGSRRR